jgi:hypothetical protein
MEAESLSTGVRVTRATTIVELRGFQERSVFTRFAFSLIKTRVDQMVLTALLTLVWCFRQCTWRCVLSGRRRVFFAGTFPIDLNIFVSNCETRMARVGALARLGGDYQKCKHRETSKVPSVRLPPTARYCSTVIKSA